MSSPLHRAGLLAALSLAACGEVTPRAEPDAAITTLDAPTCTAPQMNCEVGCVDGSSDEQHCGACDRRCESGFACVASTCEITFDGGGGAPWRYRRAIAITGTASGDQVDYVVSVRLDTAALVAAGSLSSNAADLRFATASGEALPWWTEGPMVSSVALFRVRVPTILSTGATIYAYYGNPSAVPDAGWNNGPRTFDFFDDFEGPSLDAGRWAMGQVYEQPEQRDGQLRFYEWTAQNGDADGQEIVTRATFTGSRVAELELTLDARPNPAWASQQMFSRVGAPDTVSLLPRATVWSGWWSNGVRDCAATNGSYRALVQVDLRAHMYRLVLGDAVCGEKLILDNGDPYTFNLGIEGGWGSMALDVSGYRVRAFADPEPRVAAPGPEEALL